MTDRTCTHPLNGVFAQLCQDCVGALVNEVEYLRSERRRLSNSLLLADAAIRQCTCGFGAKELKETNARD